jgi:hypothetical protein
MSSRRTPRRRLIAWTALALATALTGVSATGAHAGQASAAPVQITVEDIRSEVVPPGSEGAPEDVLVAHELFSVDVSFSAPISRVTSVTLEIGVTGGPAFTAASATRIVVPKGAVRGSFEQLAVNAAANDVVLSVRAIAPARDVRTVLPGSSLQLEPRQALHVARDFASIPITDARGGAIVSKQGLGAACTATPEQPTCVDLVLPPSAGNGDQVLFTTGVCSASVGCEPGRDVLQVLAVFELPKQDPATLVVKCDKTLCGVGSITDNVLKVSLAPVGALRAAPACSAKGVIDDGVETCVDYVQSRRDGSGDTHLYWLVPRDARMSF